MYKRGTRDCKKCTYMGGRRIGGYFMRIKKTISSIIFLIIFVISFGWLLLYCRIYLPGHTIAEVVYADRDGFYGKDTLRFTDENGNQFIFHHKTNGKNPFITSGSKVIVGGTIILHEENASGEVNSGLTIVPLWLAWIMPVLTTLFAIFTLLSVSRFVKQKQALKTTKQLVSGIDSKKIAQALAKEKDIKEEPLFEAESYEFDCKLIHDSEARKQCFHLYKNYALLRRSAWMDSAKLHEYEHIQKQKVEYIETVYIPYENVNKVRYFINQYDYQIIFSGKDFLVTSPEGTVWSDYILLHAKDLQPEELRKTIYNQTSLMDSDKFREMIKQIRHKSDVGIATVEFLKENFRGCDYGNTKGCPTIYILDDVNITELINEDRTISLPYGVYKIQVIGYLYRYREGMPDVESYKPSNTLELILNNQYSNVQIKVGRARDSGEGRHLSVKRA